MKAVHKIEFTDQWDYLHEDVWLTAKSLKPDYLIGYARCSKLRKGSKIWLTRCAEHLGPWIKIGRHECWDCQRVQDNLVAEVTKLL